MAALRANSRLQVGSTSWITEERTSALQIVETEAEEFGFSARNELDWLNEHMAEIFNENQLNVTEIFKTPGKLRGKTPRTGRKRNPLEARAPLSDIFSTTPKAAPSPLRKIQQERQAPRFQVAEDDVEPSRKVVPAPKPVISRGGKTALIDSGYHGSQASIATEADEDGRNQETRKSSPINMTLDVERPTTRISTQSEERRTTEGSFQSAKEEQTLPIVVDIPMAHSSTTTQISHPEQRNVCVLESPSQSRTIRPTSSHRQSAEMTVPTPEPEHIAPQQSNQLTLKASETFEDIQSPSDGSSPIRPIVRKSSLNFASLPAREPLTATKKSFGNRISRTSHLEQSRTSYYGRHTGGKSFGNSRPGDDQDEDDEMDVDNPDRSELTRTEPDGKSKTTQMHNKTYTQRLQDQISMLGQSQSNAPRPSKSIPNIAAAASQSTYPVLPQESRKIPSPVHAGRPFVAPGAFPDDDEEDDWIGPPTVPDAAPSIFSPRPILPKSHSTDVMEGVLGKDSISGSDFNIPKTRVHDQRNQSPFREPTIPERTASILGQVKSVSTSVIRSPGKAEEQSEPPLKKGISVSNPNLASSRDDLQSTSPPKSPSRSYRDSPLKAAKDKLSSILKTSKGLFASSAAASAGAMASTLSPPPIRNSHHAGPSFEDVIHSHATNNGSLYPSLGAQGSSQSLAQPDSPSKKASTRKLKDKEAKEAQVMEDQMNKLGREREKEAEKARAFSQQERERVAAMEKQVAAQKEQERQTKAFAVSEPRATRSSPRKTKAQLEAEGRAAAAATSIDSVDNNVEMTDATSAMPPPVLPRLTAASQIGKAKEQAKRPTKPASQPLTKAKQAPVVIRVNTGFRAFQPSNAALAASLQESLPPPAPPAAQAPLRNKPSTKTLHPKQSTDSVRSFASSTTKVKALEAAARQREKDEREAQRKREAKLELANHLDAKKNAQRALEKRQQIERAKQDRPPPPAARPQPVADLEHVITQDNPLPSGPSQRGELGQSKPAQRMNSTVHRLQEDLRPMSTHHNATKAPPKRPLPGEESQPRPTLQRNGPSYQQTDNKRRRTEEEQGDDMVEASSRGPMAPPIRQSSIRQKDGPMKSLFPSGYATAPQPPHGVAHKAPHVASQHIHQSKPAHPMDMVQNSKATINFVPNPGHPAGASHKTPARPVGASNLGGKSTSKRSAKSSPRYQNGENIELPEIHTDSEDEHSDDGAEGFAIPDWANSPNLAAGIMAQEGRDPVTVFGPPSELKMEEVFRNKERWGRFRARTSSANWSGNDRLTEEEVQRDLIARERLRREGGWTYGLS